MRKRKWYLTLLAIALVASLAGILYETSAHVVRGWLSGEAFYDGRPTSYWREQIDGWVARFDSRADAERHLRQTSPVSSSLPTPPRPTLWGRVCLSMNLPGLRADAEMPRILIADDSAEAVWRELEEIQEYGSLIDQARRNALFWRAFREHLA
jgi:hypothetical protein